MKNVFCEPDSFVKNYAGCFAKSIWYVTKQLLQNNIRDFFYLYAFRLHTYRKLKENEIYSTTLISQYDWFTI